MSGLLLSDAYSNPGTSYYLKRGEVIQNAEFQSQIEIYSPDGTKIGTIYEQNSGTLNMASGVGPVRLYPGNGIVKFLSPDSSKESGLITGDNGDLLLDNDGGNTYLRTSGTGNFYVQKIPANPGMIYDTVNNKPVTQNQIIAEQTGIISIGPSTAPEYTLVDLQAGYYSIELSVEAVTSKVDTTALQIYCVAASGAGGVINFTSDAITGSSVVGGGSGGFVLQTGIFPSLSAQQIRFYTATVNTVDGTPAAAPWVGTWIVKLTRFGTSL